MSQNSQVSSTDTVKMVVKSNQAANGNVHHIATIGESGLGDPTITASNEISNNDDNSDVIVLIIASGNQSSALIIVAII